MGSYQQHSSDLELFSRGADNFRIRDFQQKHALTTFYHCYRKFVYIEYKGIGALGNKSNYTRLRAVAAVAFI